MCGGGAGENGGEGGGGVVGVEEEVVMTCNKVHVMEVKRKKREAGRAEEEIEVFIVPCTILHRRSAVRFAMGSLYKDCQLPFLEKSGPRISVHFDSTSSIKERWLRTLRQI